MVMWLSAIIIFLILILILMRLAAIRELNNFKKEIQREIEKASDEGYREGLRFVSTGTKQMYEALIENKNENIDQLLHELEVLRAIENHHKTEAA